MQCAPMHHGTKNITWSLVRQIQVMQGYIMWYKSYFVFKDKVLWACAEIKQP